MSREAQDRMAKRLIDSARKGGGTMTHEQARKLAGGALESSQKKAKK